MDITRPAASAKRFRHTDLEAWAAAIFAQRGMPPTQARSAASLMVRSDMRGRQTHGLARLASYVQMIDDGSFNPRPQLRHRSCDGAIAFDADGALGHVAAPQVIALGLKALAQRASVLVAVREIGHLGSLGIHALAAAEGGAFCLLGQRAPAVMAMPGFTRSAIGNNPLAFACPMPHGDPLVFDMACSAAARGHILLAAREGRTIPDDWAVDEDGVRTTDAHRALQGALLPAGGHKGIGIAMMTEVLAGALSATADSLSRPRAQARASGGSSRVGAFFWFVNPGAFGSRAVFDACMTGWTSHFLASGSGHARLPGERGAALERAARATGVEISPATERELRALGEKLDLPFFPLPM